MPAHLAPNAIRRSLVGAQHTVAFTLLIVSVLTLLVFQSEQPAVNLWPSVAAIIPLLGLLFVAGRVETVMWSTTYLIVGGIGVHLYTLGVLTQSLRVHESDGFSFLTAKVALILVGGAVLGIGVGVTFTLAGYIMAELAVGLAQLEAGVPLHFDVAPFVALVAVLTLIVGVGFNGSRHMWVLSSLQRAAHEEQVAVLRYTIEVKAAALMHDTVLNHLAAIAESSSDRLDPALRQQVQRDVRSLMGEEWLTAKPQDPHQGVRSQWQDSGLFAAVREGRILGLTIALTGDLTSVSRLGREASTALGLAVKQCLVNVLKHSGTRDAEVAVYGTESEVSVLVIDAGRGFVEASTGADRLGLRSSVRKRIELVSGTVAVWSVLDRGTSIMITVPVQPDTTDSPAVTARGSS